jgi:glyoxylase-like metal-dependent hydrolase (beta-lactamase superfamily II)
MADDARLIDLMHLGRPHVIGSWLIDGVLVDPGPGSCLPTLLEALGDEVPRALALTHIHLDHAGASGALLARWPHLEIWVHERGARHMVDPSRLIASAERLYGEDMDRLWGSFEPVPAERLRVLSGGEHINGFRVAYTPGHASHHVSYLHEDTGRAFTGDVAGVRIGDGEVIVASPPPDVDLEAWRASLDVIEGWSPSHLTPTHFGEYSDVEEQLALLREKLGVAERRAGDFNEEQYIAAMRAEIAAFTDPETALQYEQAVPPDQSYQGLLRYLRRREERAG